MIRAAALAAPVALLAGLSLAACAETPDETTNAAPAAATGQPSDTSANSPMTVNPAPKGQALPSTPPTLPEDPAQVPEDKSMPPGPVNPGG